MADQAEKQSEFKGKRFRSAPYPCIALGKAIERASEFYEKAQHHTVPVNVPATAWGYTAKSGNLTSTISALKQFGLLRTEGVGDKRRFALTNDAIRIINDLDPRSVKRAEAIKRAALAPKIHTELWEKFGVAGLSGSMDVSLKTYLTLDRKDQGEAPYSTAAAGELIEEYKATISFANLTSAEVIPGIEGSELDSNNHQGENNHHGDRCGNAKVGDLIQWEVNGALKLERPLRVREVITHEGQEWVYVESLKTALPMSQVIIERREDGNVDAGNPPPPLDFDSVQDQNKWREVTDLDEGTVVLTMPESLSRESYEDLKTWMDFILAKARRRAGAKETDEKKGPVR